MNDNALTSRFNWETITSGPSNPAQNPESDKQNIVSPAANHGLRRNHQNSKYKSRANT